MKHLLTVSLFAVCFGLLSCSGGGKSSKNAGAEEGQEIDYSKPAFLRGAVKQMDIACPQFGEMVVLVDPQGNLTEITFGGDKKVNLAYDEENRLVSYVANAEARDLPMFQAEFVAPWFRKMLFSYYNADITFTYEDGRLVKFTDAKKGWTETFSYDAEGRVAGAKISDTKGNRFNNPDYSYEEINGKNYHWINSGYETSFYVYDAEGRLVGSDDAITDIVYNDRNDIVECKTLRWDDAEYGVVPYLVMTYTYDYDDRGNWIKREGKSQKWDNQSKAVTGEENVLPVVTRQITYYE